MDRVCQIISESIRLIFSRSLIQSARYESHFELADDYKKGKDQQERILVQNKLLEIDLKVNVCFRPKAVIRDYGTIVLVGDAVCYMMPI